ncbi:hypothetical protein ABT218_26835 [Streptomyces sp. NPDC001455]
MTGMGEVVRRGVLATGGIAVRALSSNRLRPDDGGTKTALRRA